MPKPVILVTGANGQLGREIKASSGLYPQFQFVFAGREDLPVDQPEKIQDYFQKIQPAYCINCAAYTAVDKAETDKETAMQINGNAPGLLAAVCGSTGAKFIHISTDYVFDGTSNVPYKEDDKNNPVNYYGFTKLKGEELCIQNNNDSIIIRTSWVYSEYGNNFVKTMKRLMSERETLNVVNDQLGSPTYAADLAELLLKIIAENETAGGSWVPGIYHYSSESIISWYDFAEAVKSLIKSTCIIHPVPTTMYPTPAKRPAYSVMSKEKIKSVYKITIPEWQDSLATCIKRLIIMFNSPLP